MDRINPFERESVERIELERPGAIDVANLNIIGSFHSNAVHGDFQRSYVVGLLKEGEVIPEDVAKWLQYRSFTDTAVATHTADDRYRFRDVQAIQQEFLSAQGGRRMYVGIDQDSGQLSAVVWLHPLEGGVTGTDMLNACEAYNGRLDLKNQEGHSIDDKHLNPARLATLASRVYGVNRGKKVHTPLLLHALYEYFQTWQACEGVIIRLSRNDSNAVGAFTEAEHLSRFAKFEHIHADESIGYLVCRRIRDPEDLFQELNAN